MTNTSYHAKIKEEKRAELMQAARALLLEQGYNRTSLAQIAKRAGVSAATLFKHFPTKASLFEAIVEDQWTLDEEFASPPVPGDARRGLTKIGRDYACLLVRPGTGDLFRLIIAELPHFPEIGETNFGADQGPFFDALCEYLRGEVAAGNLKIDDIELAAHQFIGIISGQVLWPQLMRPGIVLPDAADNTSVDHAVEMMLARYAPRKEGEPTPTEGDNLSEFH